MAIEDVKQRSSKRKRLTYREVLNAWAKATDELRSGPIGWDSNRRGGNVFERFARLGLTAISNQRLLDLSFALLHKFWTA
jgi:hypothetical protein